MKRFGILGCAILLCVPVVVASEAPSESVALGVWAQRSPIPALDISIQDGGVKYAVARQTALVVPDRWGTNFTGTTNVAASAGSTVVSIAANSAGSHCILGESGTALIVKFSINNCVSWTTRSLASVTGAVESVAISDNGTNMYAIASTGALFRSSNTGSTFTQVARTESWTDIAIDASGTRVLASTSDGQILRSTDSAASFSQVLLHNNIRLNAVASSSDGAVIFVGDQAGNLNMSTNSGSSWSTVVIPNAFPRAIADVAVSADGSKILIALAGGKLLRSANSGLTWSEEDSERNWTAVAVSPSGVHMGAGTATHFYTSSLYLDFPLSTPAHLSITATNDSNILLTPNGRVSLTAAKNFYIKRASDNSVFETIPVGDPRVFVDSSGRIDIDPSGTLSLSTTYYLDSDAGTIVDDHGNSWDSSVSRLQFTTRATDTVAPTVKSKDPSSQSVRPQPTANFSFTFNEAVQAVPGKNVQICRSNNNCTIDSERIMVGDNSKMTIVGSTVTLNPETEFDLNSTYFIRIEAGAFIDFSGNPFAGITNDSFQIYTVAMDGRAPTLRKACTSSDGAKIHLLYDEQLVSGALTASNFSVTDGGIGQPISSVAVGLHSAHVVISLSNALVSNALPVVSYVNVSGVRIEDSNSLRASGFSGVDASSRDDCAGPVVQSLVPAIGAIGVPTNSSITVTFDEPIRTDFGKSLYLHNYTTNTAIGYIHDNSSEISITNNVLTITPVTPWPVSSVIALHTMRSGFVEDLSGNDFWGWSSSIYYRFTTGASADNTAPLTPSAPTLDSSSDSGISSFDRVTNVTNPSVSVVTQENGGLVVVTARRVGQSDVTCSMTGSLSGSSCGLNSLSHGSWSVTARHADSSGNQSLSSSPLSIEIDTSSPVLASVFPGTNGTGVARGSSISMTFSEGVVRGVGSIALLSGPTCSTTVESIAVSASNVSISSNVVTVNPSGTFAENTRYCMTYPSGVFKDIAGNSVPAMTVLSSGRITFDTASNAAPVTASIISPSSPSFSRTLVSAVVFNVPITGLASSDFVNDGGSANCTFAVSPSFGTSASVTATCTSDGTVILKLRENTVLNASSITGPASAVVASTITIDTTMPSTAPSETVAPTQTIAPSSDTTLPPVGTGLPSGPAPVAQSVATTVAPPTTLTAPSTTTTTLPTVDIPEVTDDGGALIVDGQRIEATITRENNQLIIAAGVLRARISALQREGGRAPLDSEGRIRMDQGDSIEIEVTGFGTESQVEVRMYSDPVLLGRSTVSALGNLLALYEVPDSVDDGRHTVVLLGESQQGEKLTFALAVFIGAESTGPSALALLVGIPLGFAVIAALVIPAILRRRRKDEEEN